MNLKRAAEQLRMQWPSIIFSSVYSTKARELEEQDDFLNMCAKIDTEESAEEVSSKMKKIEQILQKNITVRFGPRTIDLDLLLYDDLMMKKDDLVIPHPRMHQRRFVLDPLMELIDENALHPILNISWKDLHAKTLDQDCEKTNIVM